MSECLPMSAAAIYAGSDGEATKTLYARLEQLGPRGIVGLNLFRAQKCSARAKVYRGGIRGRGSYKSMAYERKQWSMNNLCAVLAEFSAELGIRYGWKQDPSVVFGDEPSWVLYVELPIGQVSFHSRTRGSGPDYPGEFDGCHISEKRIVEWVQTLLQEASLP